MILISAPRLRFSCPLPNDSLSSLNTNLSNVRTYVGEDGKLHFTDSAGADTVLNFNNIELVCAYRPSYAVTTYFLENGVLTSYTGDNAESTNILRTFSSGSHLITVKKNCKILYSGYGKAPTIKDVEAGFSITFPSPDTSYLGYFLAIIG